MTKNQLKYYSSLLEKKHRKSENKFIAEGSKLIAEAVNAGYAPEIIFVTNAHHESNPSEIENFAHAGYQIEIVKQFEMEKLSDVKTPQGITAVFHQPKVQNKINDTDKLIVALENISDPGNVGTILRNCDWFGITQIILSAGCAELYSPKTLRASMGSAFHLNITTPDDFYLSLKQLSEKKYTVAFADLEGKNIYEFENEGKLVLVLCNEANGPTNELRAITKNSLTIPRLGKAESLNVASASAVLLSELTK